MDRFAPAIGGLCGLRDITAEVGAFGIDGCARSLRRADQSQRQFARAHRQKLLLPVHGYARRWRPDWPNELTHAIAPPRGQGRDKSRFRKRRCDNPAAGSDHPSPPVPRPRGSGIAVRGSGRVRQPANCFGSASSGLVFSVGGAIFEKGCSSLFRRVSARGSCICTRAAKAPWQARLGARDQAQRYRLQVRHDVRQDMW